MSGQERLLGNRILGPTKLEENLSLKMHQKFIHPRIKKIEATNHEEFENPAVFQQDGASSHFLGL